MAPNNIRKNNKVNRSQESLKPILTKTGDIKPTLSEIVNSIETSGFNIKLTPFTKQYIKDWIDSAQSNYMSKVEWLRFQMLAVQVDQYVNDPDKSRLSEIRINESQFGATMLDRHKMQLDINTPEEDDIEDENEKLTEDMQKRMKDATL